MCCSMYTNIDTANGIQAFKDFLNDNKDNLPANLPNTLFLKTLTSVMSNNIFNFSDTTWLRNHFIWTVQK
jgi:hypothetical protein